VSCRSVARGLGHTWQHDRLRDTCAECGATRPCVSYAQSSKHRPKPRNDYLPEGERYCIVCHCELIMDLVRGERVCPVQECRKYLPPLTADVS
jgi:hypothetical protein